MPALNPYAKEFIPSKTDSKTDDFVVNRKPSLFRIMMDEIDEKWKRIKEEDERRKEEKERERQEDERRKEEKERERQEDERIKEEKEREKERQEEKRRKERPTVDEYRDSLGLDYSNLMWAEGKRYQNAQRVRHTIDGDIEIYVFSSNGKESGFFYIEGGPHSGSILRWSLWNHYFKVYGTEWYQQMIAGDYSNVEVESGGKWHPLLKENILLNPIPQPPPKVLPSYPNGRPGDVCMNHWNYTR